MRVCHGHIGPWYKRQFAQSYLIYDWPIFNICKHYTAYDRGLKFLSNGAPHGLFCDIGHNTI